MGYIIHCHDATYNVAEAFVFSAAGTSIYLHGWFISNYFTINNIESCMDFLQAQVFLAVLCTLQRQCPFYLSSHYCYWLRMPPPQWLTQGSVWVFLSPPPLHEDVPDKMASATMLAPQASHKLTKLQENLDLPLHLPMFLSLKECLGCARFSGNTLALTVF